MTQKPAPKLIDYYGSKYRLARHYDAPRHKTVIEPFAGGAAYSLHYHWHDVRLYDLNEKVCAVWDYVIRASPDEIRSLPLIGSHESVDDFNIAQEAKWLIGWWLASAIASPRSVRTPWSRGHMLKRPGSTWTHQKREQIAQTSELIKHWKIENASYDTIENMEATWFIDPPYQCKAGRAYTHNEIDFAHLATWCKERSGQVQVCENSNSEAWLPFTPFRETVGAQITKETRKKTTEVIWRNYEPETPITLL
jgi:site-specific DNA-adenine methylase